MAIGLTLPYIFFWIFIVGISKFSGGNEAYPWLDDDLKYMLKKFEGNLMSQFRENRDWKSPKSPIDLTLAKKYFVKTRKIDFSRGGDLAYRIDHPRKPILRSFRRNLTRRLGASQDDPISGHLWKSAPTRPLRLISHRENNNSNE